MSAELLSFTPAPRLSWHRIRLSEADLQTAVHETIAAAFERAYINAHRPLAMMLWMAFTRDGGACLYLSPGSIPAAATLLNTYRARPCDAPARSPHRPVLEIAGSRNRGAERDGPAAASIDPRAVPNLT